MYFVKAAVTRDFMAVVWVGTAGVLLLMTWLVGCRWVFGLVGVNKQKTRSRVLCRSWWVWGFDGIYCIYYIL